MIKSRDTVQRLEALSKKLDTQIVSSTIEGAATQH